METVGRRKVENKINMPLPSQLAASSWKDEEERRRAHQILQQRWSVTKYWWSHRGRVSGQRMKSCASIRDSQADARGGVWSK